MKKMKTSVSICAAGLVMLIFAACGSNENNSNSEFNSNMENDRTKIDTSYMETDSIIGDSLRNNR